MLHHVKDLSRKQRHAAELEARIEALKALNERLASPNGSEVDAEEEAAGANEAMRSTRPNYRPVG